MKVLLVDDYFIQASIIMRGIASYEELNPEFVDEKELLRKEIETDFISSRMRGMDFIDLSDNFHSSGGDEKKRIFVLTEPKIGLAEKNMMFNVVNKDSDNFEIDIYEKFIRKDFDFKSAVEKIKRIKPDIILLDMGITAFAPYGAFLRFKMSNKFKTKEKFKLKESSRAYVPYDYFDKNLLRYTVNNGSGVVLGHYLRKENVPFTFWTSDKGHAINNICVAYTLGLLDKEDILDIWQHSGQTPASQNIATSSQNGKIVVYGKNIFESANGGYFNLTGKFSNEGIANLERAIDAAERCKSLYRR